MITLGDVQGVQNRIFRIRGQQVMIGQDLAALYGVSAKRLNEAVKRNVLRFPADFMFQLSPLEWDNLKPHFATSSWGGLRRATPYGFTEQGIAMLSGVLRSKRAILVNIAIMRACVKLRHAVLAHQSIARRVEKLEGKVEMHETDIRLVLEDIRRINKRLPPQGPISPAVV